MHAAAEEVGPANGAAIVSLSCALIRLEAGLRSACLDPCVHLILYMCIKYYIPCMYISLNSFKLTSFKAKACENAITSRKLKAL